MSPGPSTGKEALVTSAMRGDGAALDELARRHRAEAMLAARSIAGSSLAKDVAQEAMLLTFKSFRDLGRPGEGLVGG